MKNSGYSTNSPGTVSGVFFSRTDADHAFQSLLTHGHTADDISVLMSDETLSKHENHSVVEEYPVASEHEGNIMEQAKEVFVTAIISVTNMISLPGLGIAISRTLLKKARSADFSEQDTDEAIGAQILKKHTASHGENMKEGGIIISVDPKNAAEKQAIVQIFRSFNGHDILGDDGYTDLD